MTVWHWNLVKDCAEETIFLKVFYLIYVTLIYSPESTVDCLQNFLKYMFGANTLHENGDRT